MLYQVTFQVIRFCSLNMFSLSFPHISSFFLYCFICIHSSSAAQHRNILFESSTHIKELFKYACLQNTVHHLLKPGSQHHPRFAEAKLPVARTVHIYICMKLCYVYVNMQTHVETYIYIYNLYETCRHTHIYMKLCYIYVNMQTLL